jgi:hypothetical protein
MGWGCRTGGELHMTFRYSPNVILNLFQDPSRPTSRRLRREMDAEPKASAAKQVQHDDVE